MDMEVISPARKIGLKPSPGSLKYLVEFESCTLRGTSSSAVLAIEIVQED
jgi:hypothetical protein